MRNVTLLHATPLSVADLAISKSRDKEPYTHDGDRLRRITKVGNVLQHGSVLEHLVYSFEITGITRAVLQELARHRIASLTVKSTRYTINELADEEPFTLATESYTRAEKYIRAPKWLRDECLGQLESLREVVAEGTLPNDEVKYLLPDCYLTELVWTINARSLQNFLKLRTARAALQEIRDLAQDVFTALPAVHREIFKGHVYDDTDN